MGTEQTPIRLDPSGRTVFFTTESTASSDGGIFIAGLPSSRFTVRLGMVSRTEDNRFLGAQISNESSVRLITVPVDTASRVFGGVRVADLGAERWLIVFSELKPEDEAQSGTPLPTTVWRGVLHRDEWERVDTLRLPGYNVNIRNSSELVRWSDSVAWAFSTTTRTGRETVYVAVAHVDGRDGWEWSAIETGAVSGVAAAWSTDRGLTVAVSQHRRVGGDLLTTHRRENGGWREEAASGGGPFPYGARLLSSGDTLLAVWQATIPPATDHQIIVRDLSHGGSLDADIAAKDWAAVANSASLALSTSDGRILLRPAAGDVEPLAEYDHFVGPFRVIRQRDETYWIAGTASRNVGGGSIPTTILLRCESR